MDDEHLRDLFSGLGEIGIRRLFGGKGIYHRGMIIAIVLHDALLLKGDDEAGPLYEAAGAVRWTYQGKKRPVAMPYWTLPEGAWDDADEMLRWARIACEVALRTQRTSPESVNRRKSENLKRKRRS